MKERLLKLLDIHANADCNLPGCCENCEYYCDDEKCGKHLLNQLTDNLLKAGVMVFPVKPGDTVYSIHYNRIKEWKVYFVGINNDGEIMFTIADEGFHHTRNVYDYYIGDTIFLTQEGAINELKERRANECQS